MMLFSLIALAVGGAGYDSEVEKAGLTVFSGLQRIGNGIERFFTDTVGSVRELERLRVQYDLVVDQLREYEARASDLAALEAENARLRELLNLADDLDVPVIAARIIGKDPTNAHTTMTIDRGSRDGVRPDAAVVAVQDGVQGLVGKIVQVGTHASQVLPIYDSAAFAAARIRRSRHEGLVQGAGRIDRDLLLRYVDKTARAIVTTGDVVVTSGLSSVFPADVVVGNITSIDGRPYETTLEIGVAPAIDFGRLEEVLVVVEPPG